jgi:predicted amidohydrolase
MTFRISLVQQPLVWQDAPANRAHFAEVLRPLAGESDLVVLPEMFTTGFTMKPAQHAEDPDGETRQWLLAQAGALDAAVGGSVAIHDGDRYYNRFMIALPGGPTYWYDKRHLFRMGGEHRQYDSGDHALIVEWRGARLCPLVCYDLRFPVWSRRRPELDYDVVVYSANWPSPRVYAWSTLLRARAIENIAYCVGVNRTGEDGAGIPHPGASAVFDFMGQPLLELGAGPMVATVGIDLEAMREWRNKFPAHLDADVFTLES